MSLVMHFKFRFPFLEPDRTVSKMAKLQAGQPRKPFLIVLRQDVLSSESV
jgi:hypothetical protein